MAVFITQASINTGNSPACHKLRQAVRCTLPLEVMGTTPAFTNTMERTCN